MCSSTSVHPLKQLKLEFGELWRRTMEEKQATKYMPFLRDADQQCHYLQSKHSHQWQSPIIYIPLAPALYLLYILFKKHVCMYMPSVFLNWNQSGG